MEINNQGVPIQPVEKNGVSSYIERIQEGISEKIQEGRSNSMLGYQGKNVIAQHVAYIEASKEELEKEATKVNSIEAEVNGKGQHIDILIWP